MAAWYGHCPKVWVTPCRDMREMLCESHLAVSGVTVLRWGRGGQSWQPTGRRRPHRVPRLCLPAQRYFIRRNSSRHWRLSLRSRALDAGSWRASLNQELVKCLVLLLLLLRESVTSRPVQYFMRSRLPHSSCVMRIWAKQRHRSRPEKQSLQKNATVSRQRWLSGRRSWLAERLPSLPGKLLWLRWKAHSHSLPTAFLATSLATHP
mmetsp:Transcript_78826/g.204855  ORF Transcript_78826/g.204855 Transcript_78826/m.204855 type:complete len:206 (+) Transcript_78826:638-1255(+)